MRLIDADALIEKAFYRCGIGSILTIGDLLRAPTIACLDCKYDHNCSIQNEMECNAGCGLFERRQP